MRRKISLREEFMNCEHVPYIMGNVAYSHTQNGCGCPCHEFQILGLNGVNCHCRCRYQDTTPSQNLNINEINLKLNEVKVENHVLRGTIIKLQDRIKSLEDWKKNVCR